MTGQSNGGGEKTEAPTPKKLLDSAKKGNVLQSKELGTAISMLAGILVFALFGNVLLQSVVDMTNEGLDIQITDINAFDPSERALRLLRTIALPFAGLFVVTIISAILTPTILGSLGFRWSAIKPKAEKINPVAGLKRMFGIKGLIELGKALAKIILLASIGLGLIYTELGSLFTTIRQDEAQAVSQFGRLFIMITVAMSLGLFVIAGIDVPAQIMQRNKQLKMSKQEVKDEHKEVEGSPEVKAALRMRQQENLTNSARKSMEEATVVLANPTHFTIVLRYRPGMDKVPLVLARGRGAVALAIRELADDRSVPILEYPELTRAIYFTTPVGGTIDERLYVAVATVLAFLFKLDAQVASKADKPKVDLPDEMQFDFDGRPIN